MKDISKLKSNEVLELLLTFILLNHRYSIGRYTLSSILNISKSKSRQILELLNKNSLTQAHGKSSGRSGNYLTTKGKELVKELHELFNVIFPTDENYIHNTQINEEFQIHLFMLTSVDITNGLYERDMAVRGGANGAITYIRNGNNWIYPDSNTILGQEFPQPKTEFYSWICIFGESEDQTLGGVVKLLDYFYYNHIVKIFREYGLIV